MQIIILMTPSPGRTPVQRDFFRVCKLQFSAVAARMGTSQYQLPKRIKVGITLLPRAALYSLKVGAGESRNKQLL